MFLCKTCASLFYAFAIFYTPPDVSCYAGAVLLEEKKKPPSVQKTALQMRRGFVGTHGDMNLFGHISVLA